VRVGAVVGPWTGTFWLDLEAGTLVVTPGTDGTEVTIRLDAETIAHLVEGLARPALPARRVLPEGNPGRGTFPVEETAILSPAEPAARGARTCSRCGDPLPFGMGVDRRICKRCDRRRRPVAGTEGALRAVKTRAATNDLKLLRRVPDAGER